jgi:hypothetical protein
MNREEKRFFLSSAWCEQLASATSAVHKPSNTLRELMTWRLKHWYMARRQNESGTAGGDHGCYCSGDREVDTVRVAWRRKEGN